MSKKQSFESAFQRLEEIARLLEGTDIDLQQSIDLYEEGMKLLKLCSEKLEDAEKTLLKLSKTDGGFTTTALDAPE